MSTKPPTQVASVEGIAPKPVTMNEPESAAVDWRVVTALPPFQMFAAERMRNTSGKDSEGHALEYVRTQGGGADVFQAYCQWHREKGHWPGETPMGEAGGA